MPTVTLYQSETDPEPNEIDLTWEEFAQLLSDFRRGPCTVADCQGKKCRHKFGPAWAPYTLTPGTTRAAGNVESINMLVLDIDGISELELERTINRIRELNVRTFLHSTHSNTELDIRLRLIFPLTIGVLAPNWSEFWSKAIQWLGIPVDGQCKNLDRLYFLPSAPIDADVCGLFIDGAFLSPKAICAITPVKPTLPTPKAKPATQDLLDHIRQRLAEHGPAIEGKHGDMHTFQVGTLLLHEYALDWEDAWPLAQDWNETCEPPWDLQELAKKLANGRLYAKGKPAGRFQFELQKRLEPTGPKPDIIVGTDMEEVTDAAIDALKGHPETYQRYGIPTHIKNDEGNDDPSEGLVRPPGTPIIQPMPIARMREIVSKRANWLKYKLYKDEEPRLVPTLPPDWVAPTILGRPRLPFRNLVGVIEAPTLRPDGSIITEPGYDSATGLYYQPNAEFPDFNPRPTKQDATSALNRFLAIVKDYPFKADKHKIACVAAFITPLLRRSISSCTPMFVFDSNMPGTGKTMLADIVGILATGRDMPKVSYESDNAEFKKILTAVLTQGFQTLCIDNVDKVLGSPHLDALITSREWSDRPFGQNTTTVTVPNNLVLYTTANNLQISGDLFRRTVQIRLMSKLARPQDRNDCQHKDLIGYVRTVREELVIAALTIGSAYLQADRVPLGEFGNFNSWSRIVRESLHWLTGIDCLDKDGGAQVMDPQVEGFRGLLTQWYKHFGAEKVSIKKAVTISLNKPELCEALLYVAGKGRDLDNNLLGYKFRKYRGRVFEIPANGEYINVSFDSDSGHAGVSAWGILCL